MGARGAIAFQTLHMQQGLNPLAIGAVQLQCRAGEPGVVRPAMARPKIS